MCINIRRSGWPDQPTTAAYAIAIHSTLPAWRDRQGHVTGGEVLTDVATLGLAEIIWTPIQAGPRPTQHTVLFCYDQAWQTCERDK